ncbi:unnamed protein product [Lampetra planeri]
MAILDSIIWYWPLDTTGGSINFIMLINWTVLILYNYFNAMFVGPGYIPLGWKRCVMKMDHHCPWINNCCGHQNHAYFTSFLLLAPLGCSHAAIIFILTMYTQLYERAKDRIQHYQTGEEFIFPYDLGSRWLNFKQVFTCGTTLPSCPFPTPQSLSHSPEVLLTDFPVQDPGQSHQVTQCLQKYTGHCYVCSPSLPSVLLHPKLGSLQEEAQVLKEPEEKGKLLETYSDVVVGGTFDRLHGAHKTLLNISCLLASRRFLIGVCDQGMLKKKVLKELIEPYSQRVQRLREFLKDVKPSLQVEIVPLDDPLGVSVVDPQLQCIVVSEETRKGGEAVNTKRIENGLPALVLHEIQLLKDAHHTETEEEKISSSSLRSRLLGTLLIPPKDTSHLPPLPYVIGLTGGSGSGKSSIARQLEALGAVRIDCDKLGHDVYQPGTAAYHRVLEKFGSDILDEDKTINRRALGRKVFGNQEGLRALTDIVWPEIALLVKNRISQAREEGKEVCVVDAAVLLEAGWTDMVHEVWVTIIPEDELLSTCLFCTLKVLKAWNLLQRRIQKKQEEQ